MIVGVMTTSDKETTKKCDSLAKFVGTAVAAEGFHLLTGGGLGLMQVVGDEFRNTKGRTGKLISILRAKGRKHLTGPWSDDGKLKLKELRKEELGQKEV